jgi:hypothetical protein
MSVTAIPLLTDLQGPWAGLHVEFVGTGVEQIADVMPFMSVNDFKRLLWIHKGGDPRWAPDRVFLGVRVGGAGAGGVRPIEFHWPASVTSGGVDLVDPITNRAPNPAVLLETGERNPRVGATMVGGLILEVSLSPELMATGTIPTITAIPLAALAPATPEEMTPTLFAGFYQVYFPWLTEPAQVLDSTSTIATAVQKQAYAATVPYIEDRIGRIQTVQKALTAGVGGAAVTMTTMVRLRWILPPYSAPESLETVFYSMRATERLPFLRFFPPHGSATPILKLAMKPNGEPYLSNERIFSSYLNQPAPPTRGGVIMARAPLVSPHVESGAAFTVYVFEDGSMDVTFEVPQRGATYISAVATDAQRLLRDLMMQLGMPAEMQPTLRDIHATYKWSHPSPKASQALSTSRIRSRVAALTPFLDMSTAAPATTELAAFKWRAVSNYEAESAQFAFITRMVLEDTHADETPTDARARYVAALTKEFGVAGEVAEDLLESWYERRARAVAPAAGPTAGTLAVARHSAGTQITLFGSHPEYTIEIQDCESYEELQRILSVLGVLLGAPTAALSIQAPSAVIAVVEAAATVADTAPAEEGAAIAAEDEAADFGELDPAMAALMADLGFGSMVGLEEDAGEEAEAETVATEAAAVVLPEPAVAAAAAVAPNLEAAVAAVDEECTGRRWQPGESALRVQSDWYMARLKANDKVMFGYTPDKAKRTKLYSKSCQRRDGRQPTIMSLAEYSRVRRCYEGRVRFVDLPPRKVTDLPHDPTYNPRKKYPDEYWLTDPESGKPLWSVYNYENKSRPGEFSYLMCSELWCERDNLPILRTEYESDQGRGFAKPVNTCPFCGGGPIQNLDAPQSGESVIVRQMKESTGKLHQFIGIIRFNKHPAGYPLPCCDTSPRLLRKYLEAAFTGKLVLGKEIASEDEGDEEAGDAAAADEIAEPAAELELEAVTAPEGAGIDYRQRLGSMHTQYILGGDKALEAGKIGLLPPALDAFFGQSGPRSLVSRGIRPTFAEGAVVFVRMGVDNRSRTPGLNLFAGLAPLLGFDSAEQTMRDIVQRRMIRAFESANYGTLITEFAAKSTLTTDDISKSLPEFASEFRYRLDVNRAHVARLYKAWTAYLKYLADARTPKQLRHIEHLLAQPGVITPRGLLLVTLEQVDGRIQIVCPSFGIPQASLFGDVPVAFMWHDRRDESWEPIVLYNGTKDAVLFFGERAADLAQVGRQLQASVMQWIREWRSSSSGCGRSSAPPHVWTPERDTRGLPRLYNMLRNRRFRVSTLVRDRSNRLAGVIATPASSATPFFVPCLDDGALAEDIPRVFEVEAIPTASLEQTTRFYNEVAAEYPALTPRAALWRDGEVIGIMTEVGTMIPVTPAPMDTATALPKQQVDAFPWERDALILRAANATGAPAATFESTASVDEQLAEAYQHVRLSVSRWFIRRPAGIAVKKDLQKLLALSIPIYEKRKRADILLEPHIRDMLAIEESAERRPLSLLRMDCLALPEEGCRTEGACRWSSGRCLIHAPVREASTDPVRIFVARLSDEIMRYAMKRHELFEDDVLTIRTPRGPVLVGDQMYIPVQPKASASSILEKLGFTGRVAQQFPEELLRFEGLEEEPNIPAMAPGEEAPLSPPLPASWVEKGMQIPTPAPGLADVKRLAFAAGTGRDIEEWEKYIKLRRAKMALPGDIDRPFQWSVQDFYLIATMTMSNVLFVGADGRIKRWISPSGIKTAQPLYIIFWGPGQLLVTRGANIYRFSTKDLPTELLNQLDAASPMSEEEARGTLTVMEEDDAPVTLDEAADAEEEAGGESKVPEEAVPALVAVPPAQEEEAPALVAVPPAQEEEAPALVAVPPAPALEADADEA